MCVCVRAARGYCNYKETGTSLFRFLFENNMAWKWKHQRRKRENNKNGANSQKTKTAKTARIAKTAKTRKPRKRKNRESRKMLRRLALLLAAFLGFFGFLGFLGFLVFSFLCISPFWPRRRNFLLSDQRSCHLTALAFPVKSVMPC